MLELAFDASKDKTRVVADGFNGLALKQAVETKGIPVQGPYVCLRQTSDVRYSGTVVYDVNDVFSVTLGAAASSNIGIGHYPESRVDGLRRHSSSRRRGDLLYFGRNDRDVEMASTRC